jgi:hypothetical protein
MKATQVPELWEGDLNLPYSFDDEVYQRPGEKLKIGYFDTDGWFEPAPPPSALFKNCGHNRQGWTHLYL